MKSTQKIVKANNKALEQRFIQRVKECPIYEERQTTVYDEAYNEPINKLITNKNQ